MIIVIMYDSFPPVVDPHRRFWRVWLMNTSRTGGAPGGQVRERKSARTRGEIVFPGDHSSDNSLLGLPWKSLDESR